MVAIRRKQPAGNRQLPAGSYEHRRDGVKIVSDGDGCCSHAMSVPDSSSPRKGAGVAAPRLVDVLPLDLLPAFQTVSHRIFISSRSDWGSTYHTSNLNFFGQVSALRPLVCAQPVIPGGTSCSGASAQRMFQRSSSSSHACAAKKWAKPREPCRIGTRLPVRVGASRGRAAIGRGGWAPAKGKQWVRLPRPAVRATIICQRGYIFTKSIPSHFFLAGVD